MVHITNQRPEGQEPGRYLIVKNETLVKAENKCYSVYYCRGDDGKKYKFEIPYEPYFFASEPIHSEEVVQVIPNAKQDIFDKPVTKIVVRTPSDVTKARKLAKFHYEADIPYPMRFRYDKGIKGCFELMDKNRPITAHPCDNPGIKPKTMCIDIETLDDIDAEEAASPIVSICCKDDSKGKYIVFVVTNKTINKEAVQEIIDDHLQPYKDYEGVEFVVKTFSNEPSMFMKFKQFLDQVVQPDVLYGWNYTGYDQVYMENRIGRAIDWEPYLPFDLMAGYKKLTEGRLISDKLEDVARKELKIGKLPRAMISDLLENDIDRLVAYNLIDVYLTSEINTKREIIKWHQGIAELSGVDLDSVRFNSSIVDSCLIHFVAGRRALPSKGQLTSASIDEGGRVAEASYGIKRMVAVVDLTRAYPTTIQTNNLSPEMKVGYACKVCRYAQNCDEFPPEGCERWETEQDVLKMPSGRCYKKSPTGLIPAVFIDLIDKRKHYQALMKEAIKSGNKTDEDKYYNMQNSLKYVTNSLYGVLGAIDNEGKGKFRLADGEIGSDVTMAVRMLNQWIEEHIRDIKKLDEYLEPGEEELMALLDPEQVKPIYGDTDSVMFEVPYELAQDKETILACLNLLTELLNRSFVKFVKELSGADECLYEVEFEKFYETFFQGKRASGEGAAKKRYAGMFLWKKGVWLDERDFEQRFDVKGYEIRRSDASKFAREKLKELFKIVLGGADMQTVSHSIQDWKSKFYSGDFDVDIKIPKGIRKAEYKKNMPIQMRAAGFSNEYLGKEFKAPTKVFYCYMDRIEYDNAPNYDVIGLDIDDNPSDYGVIDYDTMYEKQFKRIFARITDALFGDDSWSELETGMFQGDLEEWF